MEKKELKLDPETMSVEEMIAIVEQITPGYVQAMRTQGIPDEEIVEYALQN